MEVLPPTKEDIKRLCEKYPKHWILVSVEGTLRRLKPNPVTGCVIAPNDLWQTYEGHALCEGYYAHCDSEGRGRLAANKLATEFSCWIAPNRMLDFVGPVAFAYGEI